MANDWNAKHYSKHSSPQFEGALELLNKHIFQGDEIVLDIGCGDGKITAEIAKRVPFGRVVGIDASPQMIAFAQAQFGDQKNIEFHHSTIENFTPNTKFDLVVSFSSFHYIDNPLTVLKKVSASLNNNGKLFIRAAGGNTPAIEQTLNSKKWLSTINDPNVWHPHTQEEYGKMLAEADFQYFDIKTIQATRTFENDQEFINWALGWIPFVTGLSGDKATELARDIIDTIRREMPEPEPTGKLFLTTPITTIIATK